MKSRFATKIICVLFSLIIALVPIFSTFGSAGEQGYDHDCPYIHVHGFMASDVWVDPDDPDSELAWPPSSDAILGTVKAVLPQLLKVLADKKWDEFQDVLIPECQKLFGAIALDENGEPSNGSGIRFTYPENVTKDSDLIFRYDWRLDPVEVAGQLDKFINYVTEKSGCPQVVLEGHSFGGIIMTSYAKLYGTSKIKSIMYNTTAVYGEEYTGELMTGNINIDADSLTAYLMSLMDYNEKEDLLNGLFRILRDAGVTGDLVKLVNYLIENIYERAIREVVMPLFGGWLSVWAMVPDDKVDAAWNFAFNNVYKDSDKDYSGLQEKIKSYNTQVRADKADTLRKLNNDCNFYVLSRYGYCSIFLVPSWKNMSDTVVDTKYSSFGATTSDYDSRLTDEQIAGSDYVSPDKTVDASTCMFPEQTWFVRNYSHAENSDDADELYKYLLYYDGQADIKTFSQYPQYLYYVEETDGITIDSLQKEEPGTIEKILNFFDSIIAKIKSIFGFLNFFKK